MTRDLYQISPKSIKKYRKYGQKYIDALQYKCQSEIVDRWMCSTHKASFLYLVKKKKTILQSQIQISHCSDSSRMKHVL